MIIMIGSSYQVEEDRNLRIRISGTFGSVIIYNTTRADDISVSLSVLLIIGTTEKLKKIKLWEHLTTIILII